MPEKSERPTTEGGHKPGNGVAANIPLTDTQVYNPLFEESETATAKLEIPQLKNAAKIVEVPRHLPAAYMKQVPEKKVAIKASAKEAENVRMVQEQCQRLCLTFFSRKQDPPLRSLGFTSAIGGEGKSFLALATARILARDSSEPVTLIECNWEHPTLHEYFAIPAKPGLAEWLEGMCSEQDIRYQVDDNLTIIPAGEGQQNAVKLLKKVQQRGLWRKEENANELLIVDLPPVITSSYGSLAAELVDTAVIVVRSEVIPGRMLAETCAQLKDASLSGIILNQENSRIPRWLRQLL